MWPLYIRGKKALCCRLCLRTFYKVFIKGFYKLEEMKHTSNIPQVHAKMKHFMYKNSTSKYARQLFQNFFFVDNNLSISLNYLWLILLLDYNIMANHSIVPSFLPINFKYHIGIYLFSVTFIFPTRFQLCFCPHETELAMWK